MLRRTSKALALTLSLAGICCAEQMLPAAERFPKPEFRETAYTYPANQHPLPDPAWQEAVDVALLIAALLAASALALRWRSRRGLIALSILCLAWFGFWRHGCICPVGSVQNVACALFDTDYALPMGVLLFFLAPLVMALFCGRVFCAGVCPLGAVQEMALIRPLPVPLWLDRPLRSLVWLALASAVLLPALGLGFPICRVDPFVTIFRLAGSGQQLLLAGMALAVCTVIGRPFCRYLCPYGALLGLASRVARWRIEISATGCIRCRLCENACPYAAILPPEPATFRHEAEQRRERRILAMCLAATPLLMAVGAGAGYAVHPALTASHPASLVVEAIALPAEARTAEQQERYDAFYQSRGDPERLRAAVAAIDQRAGFGAALAGAIWGLAIAGYLLAMTIRRRRLDYEAHRAWCFACGRCYEICPCSRSWRRQQRADQTSTAGAQAAPLAAGASQGKSSNAR